MNPKGEIKMKFEVIGTDGKVKMYTYSSDCVYDHAQLIHMEKVGYTFRVGSTKTQLGTISTAYDVADIFGKNVTTLLVEVDTDIGDTSEVTMVADYTAEFSPIEGDTYIVRWSACKRIRSYDDMKLHTKKFGGFEAAAQFLLHKREKLNGYWGGGYFTSEATDKIVFECPVIEEV